MDFEEIREQLNESRKVYNGLYPHSPEAKCLLGNVKLLDKMLKDLEARVALGHAPVGNY